MTIYTRIVDHLTDYNSFEYNLKKAAEETSELSTVLLQTLNKFGSEKQPGDQAIIDEIGDVQLRLDVLKRIYGNAEVNARMDRKAKKYAELIESKKYKDI